MRTAVLLAAGAVVAAMALLGAAQPTVGDALAANAWLVPMPRLDIFMGPVEENVGKNPDEDGPTGNDPPPPPVLYRTITTITEAPARIEKGDPFFVEGTVVAELTGEPVAGALVQLYLNETKEEPGFRVSKGRTTPDGHFRIEARVPPVLEARPYQIVAEAIDTLQGRLLYLGSFSDPDTAVYSTSHLTYHHAKTAALGVPVYFEGRIKDATGGSVRGVVVTLTIDDRDVSTAVTDDQGWFRLTHEFETPGRHDVQVRYDGSEFYYPSSDESTILVGGIGLEIQTPESVVHGEELEVRGLVVGDAAEVVGVQVQVRFHNLTVDPSELALVSDEAGQWGQEVAVPRDTPPGRYTVRYEAPSLRFSEERTLRVEALSSLTLEMPREVAEDGRATAVATLVDDDGKPLPERLVTLRGGEERVRTWTDENGTARFDVVLPGGEQEVRASFDGDALYRGSTDRVDVAVAVPIEERARPWAILALAALAVAAVVAWLLRPRGRRAVKRVVAALDPREALQLELDLPQVEADLPDVWGIGEPLEIVARASSPQGQPAVGVDLALETGAPTTLRTGEDGRVRHVVSFAEEGVADLVARYPGDAHRRPAEVARPVRVVDYRRVIEEGFDELRGALAAVGVPVHGATPPRELERRLRDALPALPAADLDRLLTLFEVSDYSPHPIGRADWITFHRTKVALGHAVAEVAPRAS